MGMPFDQTGKNRPAAEIDRFKVLAPVEFCVGTDFFGAADTGKMLVLNGNGFCPGLKLVFSTEFAIT